MLLNREGGPVGMESAISVEEDSKKKALSAQTARQVCARKLSCFIMISV